MIRVFRVFIPTTVFAVIVVDLVLLTGSYLAAMAFILGGTSELSLYLIDDQKWPALAILIAAIMVVLYFLDLYTDLRIRNRLAFLQQLCLAFGFAFIAEAVAGYLRHDLIVPRTTMLIGSLVAVVSLFSWRLLFTWKGVSALPLQRVLFLGASPVSIEVARHLVAHPELGFAPQGFLMESDELIAEVSLPRLGCVQNLLSVARSMRPDRIVVGMRERRSRLPVHDLLELRLGGVHTEEIADLYEITFSRVCTREMRPSKLIFSEALGPRRYSVLLQSLSSRGVAAAVLVLAAPVLLLVAILVRISSPGPILFRQLRVGHRNVPFTVLKFRSMSNNAEASTGAVWATPNDPRITPVGYWLRKLRLDELPQLINVLRGDMALVGPRPERPEFVQPLTEQIPYYAQRHSVLPGITGWAQINYKYGDTIEDTMMKLEYDLYYVKNISLSLDIYIMLHTAKTMLLFRGAQ